MEEALKEAFRLGYLKGFEDSMEGWNGEYGAKYPLELNKDVCEAMEKRVAEFELRQGADGSGAPR